MKITTVLQKNEIQELTQASNLRGFQAVVTTWAMIAGAFCMVAIYPSPFMVLGALVILGGRHLALAILMHDCAHYSLFRTRILNDILGRWVCAYPTWQDLKRYRVHHMDHHKHAGSGKDPDLSLIKSFPISKSSYVRKILRDLSGISGLKRIYGLVLMDLGLIKYTVAADVQRLDQKGRTVKQVFREAFGNLHGVVITNVILWGVLYSLGHPWLYLLWVVSYLTTFSVFVRIRSIAEHAYTLEGLDPLKNTRTTLANFLARITVAPHRVNYHLEHHLLMTVPYFNLPRLHSVLKERGALKGAFLSQGYLEVLQAAVINKSK
ncbi:MAG: fatty acid desaturase family protein [Bdellovibrionota bacterium]